MFSWLLIHLSLWTVVGCALGVRDSIERLIKDIAFDKFISSEYNYEKFLDGTDEKVRQLVPFKDISNDSYFRNFTYTTLKKELQTAKNKPWIPIEKVQDEMMKCAHVRYSAMSEHHFQYDKGVFGFMNMMKFSCSLVGDQFFVYGMSFGRTRFRLKPVYLRRLNKYWATSLRSITTRDVQKIVELNSLFFAEHTQYRFLDELRKLTIELGGEEDDELEDEDLLFKKKDEFIKVLPEIKAEIAGLFSRDRNHTTSPTYRSTTFNTVTIPIVTRVVILSKHNASAYIDSIPAKEASNDTRSMFRNCSDMTIDKLDFFNKTGGVGDKHEFVKERALCAAVDKEDALLVYSHSAPSFEFETTQKRTSNGVVEMKQHYSGETEELWRNLLNQQLAHAFFMHHIAFL